MSGDQPRQRTLTLVISPQSALGQAMKEILHGKPVNSTNPIKIVERKQDSEVDVIATTLGTAFIFIDRADKLEQRLELKTSSFRSVITVVDLAKLQDISVETFLFELQQEPNSTILMAHGPAEAAEMVEQYVVKLGNESKLQQAHQMIVEAYEAQNSNPREMALAIASKAFPNIPAHESRAMLEAFGSWAELIQCRNAEELAQRTPLSNDHVEIVATTLGIPLGPSSTEVGAYMSAGFQPFGSAMQPPARRMRMI